MGDIKVPERGVLPNSMPVSQSVYRSACVRAVNQLSLQMDRSLICVLLPTAVLLCNTAPVMSKCAFVCFCWGGSQCHSVWACHGMLSGHIKPKRCVQTDVKVALH